MYHKTRPSESVYSLYILTILQRIYFSQEGFTYERAPLENNKYHGNLLLDNSLSKQTRQMIMTGLALAAGTNIIPQTNEI